MDPSGREATSASVRGESAPANPDSLLEGLNGPQRDAVTYGEGPLLVLAGAGSGKTRALTHRIAWLLANGLARPNEILAITFTNKAAQEMRDRVASLVGEVERRMWVATFHAACARLLRAEAETLGFKSSFTIYDEADARRMMKRSLEGLDVDVKRYPPRAAKARVSAAKNQLISPERFAEEASGPFEEIVAAAYADYQQRLLDANAMDFDDLLVNAVRVLELDRGALSRYRSRFRWVLVDEYQDTNRAQYELLRLLCADGGNLTVVGDDSQSIYGFRGSDVRNILEFDQDFPGAGHVKLEQNYRSTQNLLSAANAVIENNRENLSKHLWTDRGEGDPVRIVELSDEHAEARYVAGEVESLIEEGVPREEIAVFYRVNAQSRVLEDVLVRYEMPYQVIGGTKFYERAEIKDAIAYLTLIQNPADAMAFGRVVNSPKRGIGETSQARLLGHANTTGADIWAVALAADQVPGLGKAALASLRRFTDLIEGLREESASLPVAELLREALERSGYLEALEAERTVEAEGRLENLEELIGVAAEFDAAHEKDPERLAQFLQEVSLFTDQDGIGEEEAKITLMTLHNAKGLEFDSVFVIGCEEGVFPHSRALEEGEEGEERRLCYVGMTRAKARLWMTSARSRRMFGGRAEPAIASRFLDEIPSELVEREGAQTVGALGSGAGSGWPTTGGFGQPTTTGAADARMPSESFSTGDDVIHPSFGEGVVTAIESDGVIAVRFANEREERRLMADYAPLRRAGAG